MPDNDEPLWYGVATADELRQLRAFDEIMKLSRAAMKTASDQKEHVALRVRERYRHRTGNTSRQRKAAAKKTASLQFVQCIGCDSGGACRTEAQCLDQ